MKKSSVIISCDKKVLSSETEASQHFKNQSAFLGRVTMDNKSKPNIILKEVARNNKYYETSQRAVFGAKSIEGNSSRDS